MTLCQCCVGTCLETYVGENIRIVTDVDLNKKKKKKHNICESDNFMHTCESLHKENCNPSKHVLPPNAERMSLFGMSMDSRFKESNTEWSSANAN